MASSVSLAAAATEAAPEDDSPSGALPAEGRGGTGDVSRRRFVIASIVGVLLVTPAFLWVACDLWSGGFHLDRYLPYEANFYDLQARAMLSGHLYLQNGSIGIEAFGHDGHQYTYFGLFPSLIRLPVLLFTHRLDARLTVPSMLIAWLVTALCSSLLIWRVRCYLRGDVLLGRMEAVSLGALVATICGGSVLVSLAATPFVFDEDLAWSIALTVACVFLLLGILERPTTWRIVWFGVLVLAANLNRVTTGWGCAFGALLVAGWFGLGKSGPESRRFAPALAAAGVVPLLVGAAINMAKFGQPFGLPIQDQVFSQVNAYRRQFLAANGGEVGLRFVPSTALAYLRPDGLRISSLFPFISVPSSPAGVVGHVLFDRTYPTASVTASMPLLFLLTCWGVVFCLGPRRDRRTRSLILLVLAAGTSSGAILLWGYIAERYLADFVPLLVLGSAIGAVDIWRRLEGRRVLWRRLAFSAFALVALLEIATNVAIAVAPNDEWNGTQVANFVSAQENVGAVGGPGLAAQVVHGSQLPAWMPVGTIFEVGDCTGLYVSNGDRVATIPLQKYQHATWMPADEGVPYRHVLQLTFAAGAAPGTYRDALVTAGPSTVSARVAVPAGGGPLTLTFVVTDPTYGISSLPTAVVPGSTHTVDLITDAQLHQVTLTMDGTMYVDGVFTGGEDVRVDGTATARPVVTVADVTDGAAETALCRRVVSGS